MRLNIKYRLHLWLVFLSRRRGVSRRIRAAYTRQESNQGTSGGRWLEPTVLFLDDFIEQSTHSLSFLKKNLSGRNNRFETQSSCERRFGSNFGAIRETAEFWNHQISRKFRKSCSFENKIFKIYRMNFNFCNFSLFYEAIKLFEKEFSAQFNRFAINKNMTDDTITVKNSLQIIVWKNLPIRRMHTRDLALVLEILYEKSHGRFINLNPTLPHVIYYSVLLGKYPHVSIDAKRMRSPP